MADLYSRRQATGTLLRTSAGLVLLPAVSQMALPRGAFAQRGTGQGGGDQKEGKPSPLDHLLKRTRERAHILKADIQVQAFKDKDAHGLPIVAEIDFATAAVVFPILDECANAKIDTEAVTSELSFNDKVVTREMALKEGYAAGTRLGVWTMRNKRGREFRLQVNIPMTCWKTEFDEQAAAEIEWPKAWSATAASTLVNETYIDYQTPEVRKVVDEWTGGKGPRTIKPVTLVKYFTSKLIDHVQPSGNGLAASRTGQLEGVSLAGASKTLAEGKGTQLDLAPALVATLRAAGLPSRIVAGYSHKDDDGGKGTFLDKDSDSSRAIRVWAEFCLYDEEADKELWVPVDPLSMRLRSSRAPNWQRPWPKYLGTFDDFDEILPFAFHFHPPTTVIAHGSYGFWGWMTTPKVQVADQTIRFQSQTRPKRGG